ncbi:AhpC/TSA family protein [Heterostelium album PN500]|uniref:thioredoxin-dependent peroxiredoxin n=1 Tax=Heterostelium pallidum (strain ATCC 26659 / Pp 5 / PN500) TaxID=670386 RepID=D3B0Z6_HETP5|nr:AhpC/TSA family protein [Heterostelium album PN500]EFA84970.1 AhpC/TSA family protein [Heterostelium album PN500]|eukprot:XP_020437080.1 AhpC/TSA family protein [Heterostelium album PN500]
MITIKFLGKSFNLYSKYKTFNLYSSSSQQTKKMTKLKIGDDAPEFSSTDKDGNHVDLAQFKGKILVLYFYPKDNTPGCTAEACEFRDKYEEFVQAGASVVGVSSDSSESHQKFTSKYKLPFTLITDKKNEIAHKYGVGKELLFLPGRSTFIIDQNGKIACEYSSLFKATNHISEALKCINDLKTKQ